VQHSQHAHGAGDRVSALGAEQRSDLAARESAFRVFGRQRQFQVIRVTADHPVDEIDLFERRGQSRFALQRAGHVDRPELGADPAAPEPRQVSVHRWHIGREVHLAAVEAEPLADFPR
jgi:hypothetical protein